MRIKTLFNAARSMALWWCVPILGWLLLAALPAWANIPGGGTGSGPAVTLVNNGNGTVTMANGIVTLVITTSDANINQIYYSCNNSGAVVTNQLLAGGTDGGQLYWTGNPASFGTMNFAYSVVTSTTNYCEIALTSASATNGVMEVHYGLLRGSTGFYTTAILTHRSGDGVVQIVLRPNIYAGSQFNWMTVDATRNRLMEVAGGLSIPVQNAPKEVYLWTNGIYAGQYEDKYKYTADLGLTRVWGWSSVGQGGSNVGIWNVSASMECYPGGPLERSLMEHIGTTILNVFTGGYFGLGTDDTLLDGEIWSKVYGPYFYYFNNVTNTLTATNQAAQALYGDALAQGAAEQSAWPYAWFTNANYTPAAGRGVVTGQLAIADRGNPNASPAGLWVGVVQQPSTNAFDYDFQEWAKPYQFWVQTDTNGNFTLPDVIAGTNYTLYAFGPGAADTFLSQLQAGGNPPLLYDLPVTPFSVTVAPGGTNNLGVVTWSPTRVGATVFEIGYPDRTARKFRHGDDYWVGDRGPGPTQPAPVWDKFLEFPFDFPNGPNYVVGQSRWTTDWNYIQPIVTDSAGNFDNSSSTITFTLAAAPTNGARASLYLGLASDYYAAIIVSVNGNNLSGVSGLVGTPNNNIPSTGYYVGYGDSDSSDREGNNGAFSDERLTFPASQLHAGVNTINIGIRQTGGTSYINHAMYDYIRLELTGYVPPAPASVTAYAGNNCNLVCWPVTPGATSYNVWRSTVAGSGYVAVTNGVVGPVCGSGANNATWVDPTAANGTTYYYQVQAANPGGTSTNSAASAGATPAAGFTTSAPAAPMGLVVSSFGHQSVTLNWTAAAGANYYSVWRSTLEYNGGGASNTLSTILLENTNAGTSFTDTSTTDGSIYRYFITATSAGGMSSNSLAVAVVPVPAAPASLPVSLTGSFVQTTNITLNWYPVPGAMGYDLYRAISSGGPYTFLQSVTETNYTDYGLNAATVYYYRVAAMNTGGVSAYAADSINSQQAFPAGLTAASTNAQVILTWPVTAGATSYTVKRGTSSGNETTTVITGYAGTSYTNTSLVNGTTYYYVVTATGAGGASGNSPEASATPFATTSGIWTATTSGNWGVAANWSGGAIAYGPGSTADFSTLALPANLTVTLDSARTISTLKFGDTATVYNWTLAGTNPLTLGASPDINVANQTTTISSVLAGTAGLTKTGLGTLTLGGVAETFTGGMVVNAGNLVLDFSVTNLPAANLIPTANTLALGGGTLQIYGASNVSSSQAFAATTLNAGESVVAAAPMAGVSNPVVTLGAITANAGGLVEFFGPPTVGAGGAVVSANATMTTTTPSFVGGNGAPSFAANYATVGLYDFATMAGGSPYTVTGGSQVSGFYTPASGGSPGTSGNLDVTGNITGWSAQPYLTSMRFNTNPGGNLSVSASSFGSTLTLADILVTPNVGARTVTFNNGVFRSAGGSSSYGGPLVVWQNNTAGELILNTPLENSKAGTAAYVQAGPGTVAIPGTGNTYADQSYLNGGVTLIAGDGSLGAPTTAAVVNLNGGTLAGNALFTLDSGGANPRPINLLGQGGGLAATAGNTVTVDGVIGSAAAAGPLTIGIPASGANGNTAGLLPGTGANTASPAPVYATGTVVLTGANYYTGGTRLQSGTLNINGIFALGGANYGGLTFNGGTLQYAVGLAGGNGSADLTSIGTAGITLAAAGGVIDVNGNTVTFAGSVGNHGPGALTVKSSLPNGMLTLSGANTYQGTTTITNVTMLVGNSSGSATGSGDVLVQNGGTLAGAGALIGSVTVTNGGVLTPASLSGALTIGGNLALAAGSKTVIQVQHPPPANPAVMVGGTLAEGGTLTVTNSGATGLAAGDNFVLFSAAGGYAGAFGSVTLPLLNPGLFWSTTRLTVDGSLAVVSTNPPSIISAMLSGGNLVCQGTGGPPGWYYYLISSTNLSLPTGQWTVSVTNQFDATGGFNCTFRPDPGVLQQYFTIEVQ